VKTEYKFIKFVEHTRNNLPNWWEIMNIKENDGIGIIEWYPRWRKYIFMSASADYIFDKTCLKDIIAFIEDVTKERAKK